MSVMSTGRRPGAGVRRLSPDDAYSLPRQPGSAGGQPNRAGRQAGPAGHQAAARRRPGRPRLRLVPPLPAEPVADQPAAPPRGRTPVPADTRVPAPRAASVPPATAHVAAPARVTAPDRSARPGDTPAGGAQPRDTPARSTRPGRDTQPRDTPARVVRPARAPATRVQPRRRVRLTRRGRLVVWALAVLVAAALLTPVWLIAAAGAQAANHGLPPAAVHAGLRHVVVRPGQTLWSIAATADPAADPRVVVQEIMQVNALSNGVVVPGESLWVPAN